MSVRLSVRLKQMEVKMYQNKSNRRWQHFLIGSVGCFVFSLYFLKLILDTMSNSASSEGFTLGIGLIPVVGIFIVAVMLLLASINDILIYIGWSKSNYFWDKKSIR